MTFIESTATGLFCIALVFVVLVALWAAIRIMSACIMAAERSKKINE